MQLLRWDERLGQYQYSVEYWPGQQNTVADMLSRNKAEPSAESSNTSQSVKESDSERQICTIFGNPALAVIEVAEVRTATMSDEQLQAVAQACSHGWPI